MTLSAAMILVACGSKKAEDIKVEDLKDACECVEATGIVADDIISFMDEKGGNPDEMEESDVKTAKDKFGKIEEIMNHCRTKLEVSRSDMKECSNYEEVDKKMDKLNKY